MVDYEVFLIFVILRAGCNEIESIIVKCIKCVSWGEEKEKEGENKNTKWENGRDRQGYMALTV